MSRRSLKHARQRCLPSIRTVRSISLKSLLKLKKTTPDEDAHVVENKTKSYEDDSAWGCLHFNAIELIVHQANLAFPQEFRKILFSASLLNKHWKLAIDNIVDKLDLRMQSLEKADLRMNWQLSLDALLKRFSSARRLRLTSIDGDSLNPLKKHTHIEDLELYAVDFSSAKTLKGLARLDFLQGLKFRNSPSLDDRTLKAVACCSHLKHLDLTGCSLITGEGIKSIASVESLVHLYLGDCSGLSTEGLLTLSSLCRLETLNLSGVHTVTDAVLHGLSELPRLANLDIFMCPNVTDIGLWYLARRANLKILNLFSCDKITDEGLRAIAQQQSLRKLNLGWCCLITDYGIQFLSELELLCELRLSWVPITIDALERLAKLRSLTLLDVRGCDINPTKLTQGISMLRKTLPDSHLTILRS